MSYNESVRKRVVLTLVLTTCAKQNDSPCQQICSCLGSAGGSDCESNCEERSAEFSKDIHNCLDLYDKSGCEQHCSEFGSGNLGGSSLPVGWRPPGAVTGGGPECGSGCDYCWCDSAYEDSCLSIWDGTVDGCDCCCQFDDPDCDEDQGSSEEDSPTETGGGASSGSESESESEGETQSSDCIECGLECDNCWCDSICSVKLDGDGPCDCGCGFADIDCG